MSISVFVVLYSYVLREVCVCFIFKGYSSACICFGEI